MKKYYGLIGIGSFLLAIFILSTSLEASAAAQAKLMKAPQKDEVVLSGPPWFDVDWNYRRPIVISNGGNSLAYYQVLVVLNNTNFNFTQANADGSDIRFTHSDGTTELRYWIEYWSGPDQLAYVWVRVPSLASGDTVIYLYYGNPGGLAASSGSTTFDGFDSEWSQFTTDGIQQSQRMINSEIENPFMWSSVGISPTVTAGILNLVDGSGIKSTTTYQYSAVGMRANFGLDTGREWAGFINGSSGQRTIIGDLPSDATNIFLTDFRNDFESILLPRANGEDWHNAYHVYEIRWKSGQAIGDIDHGISTAWSTNPMQVPNIYLPVTLYSLQGSTATLMVDWVYLRQYREPEPSALVMDAQGLINLGVDMVDFPDPLPKNAELTYQLAITNNSNIDSPGVIVTDTLPISLQVISATPSQGNCSGTAEIVCNLGLIQANSSAGITIVGSPTANGYITNTVFVDSLGFDVDMSNNVSEAVTLVDSDPPHVNWEKPVHNGEDYISYGGEISLEASATDNDQVAWVEFWWWDHLPILDPRGKVSIGYDYAYPYQMQFDSTVLLPNEEYQVFVQAADRAGNLSDIYVQPYPRIFITRIQKIFFYLPVSEK
jgi:uncharacterized repeat protein (TIGR01451 family)